MYSTLFLHLGHKILARMSTLCILSYLFITYSFPSPSNNLCSQGYTAILEPSRGIFIFPTTLLISSSLALASNSAFTHAYKYMDAKPTKNQTTRTAKYHQVVKRELYGQLQRTQIMPAVQGGKKTSSITKARSANSLQSQRAPKNMQREPAQLAASQSRHMPWQGMLDPRGVGSIVYPVCVMIYCWTLNGGQAVMFVAPVGVASLVLGSYIMLQVLIVFIAYCQAIQVDVQYQKSLAYKQESKPSTQSSVIAPIKTQIRRFKIFLGKAQNETVLQMNDFKGVQVS